MNWRDYLTPDEIAELAKIEADKRAGQAQVRRIYDRCQKRMATAETKGERENFSGKGKTAPEKSKDSTTW